ncbi:MAG: glycosyltransferase family 2 protein [Saprospiraceae bacterium]|nr:glycosyltransferase family 2 protein [Saprospiraceae bacterium]
MPIEHKDHLPALSIVVPVYNEGQNVDTLLDRLRKVLTTGSLKYEILIIDDGSTDHSYQQIEQASKSDSRIRGISFSRNFGHQIALLAGLQKAKGSVVITMDGDLQHPPEVIPTLINKWKEGFDIVNTVRIDPPETGIFKAESSRWFYKIINRIAEVNIQPASADFRLMSRSAVDAFLQFPERDRFTRGLVSWMGFRQTSVTYNAELRHSGKSKYSFAKMLRFALDGITSFSSRPLQLSFYLGLIVSLLGFIYGIYIILAYLQGQTIPGWTSLLLVLLIIGGVILINLGIVGEYIARIFNEVKARPHYFIKETTDSPVEIAGDEQE